MAATREPIKPEAGRIVDMSWDPITRIVGNLGIYTKIDFDSREVVSCKATSSLFRGYSVFMKGKDPRDAHFITSRICGICGDNHAVCSLLRAADGLRRQAAAAGRVDRQPRRGRRVHLRPHHLPGQPGLRRLLRADGQGDQPERLGEGARRPPRPGATSTATRRSPTSCASYNPFTGETYREALHMSRIGREMICLMEGRHVHPSTIYPGGVGTVADADAAHRLPEPAAALPGLHQEGRRDERRRLRLLLRGAAGLRGGRPAARSCSAAGARSTTPTTSTTTTRTWTTGATRCSSPRASSSTASSSPRTSSTSTSASGSCSAPPTTRTGRARRRSSPKDPLGNPVDKRHPWNQTTIPKPQKRDLDGGNYSWVMSPRWFDKRTGDNLAMDTGGGALARLWATALANKVHTPYVNATGHERADQRCPRRRTRPRSTSSGRSRSGRTRSSATARGSTSSPTPRAWRCTSSTRRSTEVRAGRTKMFENFDVPDEAIGCGFHEAVRGVLSHHMVIRDGKIANYHPYPPTPWNGSPDRLLRHARALRGRVQRHADLRGGRRGELPRHRHHARGPQLRPVPAVRRAHVPRQRQDDQAGALADVRRARDDGGADDRGAAVGRGSRRSRVERRRAARGRDRARAGAAGHVRRGARRGSSPRCDGAGRGRARRAPAAPARPASGAGRASG